MSWFGNGTPSTQELDSKIEEATSESIPNGEFDVAVAFEITDIIRSKKISPKQCMRCLKKRLTNTYQNPNLLTSSLKLVDVCVKNGGYHFLVELSSKEFMDYLVDFIFKVNYNIHDGKVIGNQAKLDVGNLILGLIKNWKLFFKNQLQLNYVETCYNDLVRRGYEFPETDTSEYLNGVFIDSETPADWVDNDECMICYKPFSMMNRKHHCRSCGGVFCQEHSSHSIPLPSLGITEPVRVCDNCHFKLKYKLKENNNLSLSNNKHSRSASQNNVNHEGEDEDLKRAIEMSLKESGGIEVAQPSSHPPSNPPPKGDDEEDEEMKAAIAASLKEFQAQEQSYKQQSNTRAPQPILEEPKSEFYNNIFPFDKYSTPQSDPYQATSPSQYQYSSPPQQSSGPLTPAQHMEKHNQLHSEGLTQNEEDSISLYVTLINQIKTDKSRQSNVLHDKDLNDLHSKVIQIKPKLNRTLRSSIERYETFVALNNKISTITKLYDQFLENKLSQAYGNQTLYNPYPNQQYDENYKDQNGTSYQTQSQHGYSNGYGEQQRYTGYPGQDSNNQYSQPQSTGQYNQPQATGQYSQPQTTGQYNQPQTTGQYNQPQTTGQYSQPQAKGQYIQQQATDPLGQNTGQYSTSFSPQTPTAQPYPSQHEQFEESEPNYDEPESTTQSYNAPIETPSYSQEFTNISAYPPIENTGKLRSEPDYPPTSTYPEQNQYDTGSSIESTRSRFPPIEDVKAEYPQHPSASNISKLPQLPDSFSSPPPTSFTYPSSEETSKRVEEPLIDL
ncbi:Vacuolar protein-sorting-associated protein 27 [Yamadazyma tenuis]|uniref:Vacuolar protein sorting-associated protein 27 n=1 Tax=Candida tenuis (strain ATCC 10573 / BCRC 21748 / CBS 615 / JCM 9827 / NBRC 10315 / NRRL Y-1498 / VKM Y-70) TaxID=590646 RepID=G3AY44_CANTC|nr:ubiquitin binding protein [Yamadazyma tenuis ATCC 10573]EGV65766.1 ubiquitin binding protein [Yamadazyma tenuis ATCC 10573]WEJ95914.1 Vacuolar protein-sorting-associated protein 27 [Yamadazyma tenuis]